MEKEEFRGIATLFVAKKRHKIVDAVLSTNGSFCTKTLELKEFTLAHVSKALALLAKRKVIERAPETKAGNYTLSKSVEKVRKVNQDYPCWQSWFAAMPMIESQTPVGFSIANACEKTGNTYVHVHNTFRKAVSNGYLTVESIGQGGRRRRYKALGKSRALEKAIQSI
jgi:hypothetical protein